MRRRYAGDRCRPLAPSDTPRQTARGLQSTTRQTATTAGAPEVLPALRIVQTAPPRALPWRKGLPVSRMRRNRDQRREGACLRAQPATARGERRPGSLSGGSLERPPNVFLLSCMCRSSRGSSAAVRWFSSGPAVSIPPAQRGVYRRYWADSVFYETAVSVHSCCKNCLPARQWQLVAVFNWRTGMTSRAALPRWHYCCRGRTAPRPNRARTPLKRGEQTPQARQAAHLVSAISSAWRTDKSRPRHSIADGSREGCTAGVCG